MSVSSDFKLPPAFDKPHIARMINSFDAATRQEALGLVQNSREIDATMRQLDALAAQRASGTFVTIVAGNQPYMISRRFNKPRYRDMIRSISNDAALKPIIGLLGNRQAADHEIVTTIQTIARTTTNAKTRDRLLDFAQAEIENRAARDNEAAADWKKIVSVRKVASGAIERRAFADDRQSASRHTEAPRKTRVLDRFYTQGAVGSSLASHRRRPIVEPSQRARHRQEA